MSQDIDRLKNLLSLNLQQHRSTPIDMSIVNQLITLYLRSHLYEDLVNLCFLINDPNLLFSNLKNIILNLNSDLVKWPKTDKDYSLPINPLNHWYARFSSLLIGSTKVSFSSLVPNKLLLNYIRYIFNEKLSHDPNNLPPEWGDLRNSIILVHRRPSIPTHLLANFYRNPICNAILIMLKFYINCYSAKSDTALINSSDLLTEILSNYELSDVLLSSYFHVSLPSSTVNSTLFINKENIHV